MPEILTGVRPASRVTNSQHIEASPSMPDRHATPADMFMDAAPKIGVKYTGAGKNRKVVKRHFQSLIKGLRITIKSEKPRLTPTGEYVVGEHTYAQFRDGHIFTDNKDVINKIEGNKDYGVTIWDSDAWIKVAKLKKVEAAKRQIFEDPDVRGALMADPQVLDFLQALAKGEEPALPPSLVGDDEDVYLDGNNNPVED